MVRQFIFKDIVFKIRKEIILEGNVVDVVSFRKCWIKVDDIVINIWNNDCIECICDYILIVSVCIVSQYNY